MKKVLSTMLLMAVTVAMMAVPAKKGVTKTITVNGNEVQVMLVGDEHGHYWKAQNGKAYQMIGGMYQEIDAKVVIEKAKARRAKVNAQRVQRRTFGHPTTITGQKKAIMILVNFKDEKYKTGHDNALFQKIANKENYNEGKFKGSMADYFKAQSRGKFELDFDVVGPVTVSKNASYYGENDSQGNDKYPGAMVCEAVKLAKEQVSDWTPYDWDNDGKVDQVYVVYAGKGEADGGDDDTIWPHAYDLTSANYYGDGDGPVTVGTNLKVNSYACGPELDGQTGDINGIGTMCHEYSHCLGYPDFYDIDYSGGQGMGAWDLMDAGPYNGGGFQPAGYTSYERWFAGWENPIVLKDQDMTVENMKSLQNGGESYIIYNKGHQDEYYLLENRQLEGWDASLPAAGLLILHCDYNASVWEQNGPNDDPDHQRLTVVPGDGAYQTAIGFDWTTGEEYEYFTDEGIVTDPFPQNGYTSFNRSYVAQDKIAKKAARLFNANADGTYCIDSSVEGIKQNADGTISFNFVANYAGEEPVATGDFEKVTDASQIVVGNEYLLVNEEYYAANSTWDYKYLTVVEVDIEDGLLSGEGYAPMTLGGDANGYSLKLAKGYLNTDAAKSLKLSSIETTIWKIAATEDGYVVKAANDSYGTIQFNYNSGNARFMNYTSSQKPAVLYVKKTTTGIENVKTVAVKNDNRIYTLDGRFVGNDFNALGRGLYIVNGKKVVK